MPRGSVSVSSNGVPAAPQLSISSSPDTIAQVRVENDKKYDSIRYKTIILGAGITCGSICGICSWALVVPYMAIDYFVNHLAVSVLISNDPLFSDNVKYALFFVSKSIVACALLNGLGFGVHPVTALALDAFSAWLQ